MSDNPDLMEKCIVCNELADGQCENCDAPICFDHDADEFEDVLVCADHEGCTARIEEKNG